MFVDASAAVAVILKESDMDEFRKKLKATKQKFMSSIAEYETAMAVRRDLRINAAESLSTVRSFQTIYGIEHLSIGHPHSELALEAFDRFGKGRHKAGLNMGDCFSYACARANKIPLLFKGSDFIHTDIAIA
jgi:ribonuclease VapC